MNEFELISSISRMLVALRVKADGKPGRILGKRPYNLQSILRFIENQCKNFHAAPTPARAVESKQLRVTQKH
jgi:hypothetical protein